MKSALAAQQKQIEILRETVEKQRLLLELWSAPTVSSPDLAIASLAPSVRPTPIVHPSPSVRPAPPSSRLVVPLPKPVTVASSNPCNAETTGNVVPSYFRLGGTCIVPVGFMDVTGVWRNTNTGSGLGSNFGSIPYNNTVQGGLSEFRFSAQNSRIGMRVDSAVKNIRVTGYLEADFFGFVPTNAAVTSNADTLRMRLYWLDLRKGKWEGLAGQSWSLMTPNRNGLSPLPGDVFFSMAVDSNYMNGLVWTRQAQIRAVYHPNSKLAMGLSLEAPEQYIGGSGGGGAITMPAALASSYATQLNNGSTTMSVPNSRPDVVVKAAFDTSFFGGRLLHLEAAGLARSVSVFNQLSNKHFAKSGVGGSLNGSVGLTRNFRLVSNNFASDGGGRYLFGLAPDAIIRADGSPSLVNAYGTVDGMEASYFKSILFAYYGGTYIARNSAVDANGRTLIGYGFAGSSNSNNRAIQEITWGFNRTAWKDPRYGALNYMAQYAWMVRAPWWVAPGAPQNAHLNMVEFGLRYTLPGDMPKF
jgi:hypothetical protein